MLIVSTGAMVHKGLRVAEKLKSAGIEAAVMDVYRLKPIDEPLFLHYADRWGRMVTLEEHSLMGGLGSIVSEILADHGKRVAVKRFGIRDMLCEGYGDREWMHTRYGLDDRTLIESISAWQ